MTNESIRQSINESTFFDHAYYNSRYDFDFDRADAVEHYILQGESEFRCPSKNFDPKFYSDINNDLIGNVDTFLLHYIQHGQHEARYANRQDIIADGKLLTEGGFFDEKFYAQTYGNDTQMRLPLVSQYLAKWRKGHRPNSEFDDIFYYNLYPDVHTGRTPPSVHYVLKGKYEARLKNENEYFWQHANLRDFFEVPYYLNQFKELTSEDDLPKHYLTIGKFKGARPNSTFSPDYYVRRYPDIRTASIEPALHYKNHGKSEGRIGSPVYDQIIEQGGVDYDYDKQTIIIANHEASRTGAPLVGLNLARELGKKYNIINYVGIVRDLDQDFKNSCSFYIKQYLTELDAEYVLRHLKELYNPLAIVMNSVEASTFAPASLYADIPSVSLIHEFSEYSKPTGKVYNIVKAVDRVIVPAEIIYNSVQREVLAIGGDLAKNIVVAPQGKLPFIPRNKHANDLSVEDIQKILEDKCDGKTKFVLGAGYSGIRKGVDLFVQTAYELSKIRNDVAFIWCGGGYNPNADAHYSVWVSQMIERMNLTTTVQFVPEQSNLDDLLNQSDVFFLSSRLDPFPNVIIDALEADKPIVCFEGATGCAEIFGQARVSGKAVPHCDVSEAARAINQILNAESEPGLNRDYVKNHLNFQNYVEKIEHEISIARKLRTQLLDNVQTIKDNNLMDVDFYIGSSAGLADHDIYIKNYAAGSAKGIANINPKQGFSDNIFRNTHETNDECALVAAFNQAGQKGKSVKTHDAYNVDVKAQSVRRRYRLGVHFHLHYPDLSNNFVERLSNINHDVDLYITTNTNNALNKIKSVFDDLSHIKIKYYEVQNRGRDIGPFFSTVSADMRDGQYDIVGHFHGKKSLSSDATMGASWREFILDTLMGNGDGVIDNIASLMMQNDSLGLLFAEDRFNVGWSENLSYAKDISKKIPLAIDLPEKPFFPIGTMFWAKPKVFQTMWQHPLTLDIFPPEPLPYDGSVLHALERMIPTICEAEGMKWATAYRTKITR